jgi:hypothetical protein
MAQLQRRPLFFRELGDRLGQAQELLVALGLPPGLRVVHGQPGVEARRRLLDGRLQRSLQGHVPLLPTELAQLPGKLIGQDLAQPAGHLGVALAAELVPFLMSLQKRFLHDVRRVQLGPQPGSIWSRASKRRYSR